MRQTVMLAAALLGLAGGPAVASPEQDAATAYCAARAAGRSEKEASDAAAVQISRGRGLAYVLMYRQQIKDQVEYLAGQQCPNWWPSGGGCQYDLNGRYTCASN